MSELFNNGENWSTNGNTQMLLNYKFSCMMKPYVIGGKFAM